MKQWRLWMMLGTVLFLTACNEESSTAQIPVVKPFEIDRYLGTWYEIARLPQWFERDMDYVTAEYYQTPNGGLRVRNRGFRNNEEKIPKGSSGRKPPLSAPANLR